MRVVGGLIALAALATTSVSAADLDAVTYARQITDMRKTPPLPQHDPVPPACSFKACGVDVVGATAPPPSARSALKRDRYHWFALTDDQDARLRAELAKLKFGRPVWVLYSSPDALDLAEDVDTALRDAGADSSIMQAMDTVDGLHCTWKDLCDSVQRATGIKYALDPDETCQVGGSACAAYVVNFGRKK